MYYKYNNILWIKLIHVPHIKGKKEVQMKKISVETVLNELKSLAEDMKSEMSANVYEYIHNMCQSVEHNGKEE